MTKKDNKSESFRFDNQTIEIIENFKDYFIPNFQYGFSSRTNMVEKVFEYLITNNLLIKRENEK